MHRVFYYFIILIRFYIQNHYRPWIVSIGPEVGDPYAISIVSLRSSSAGPCNSLMILAANAQVGKFRFDHGNHFIRFKLNFFFLFFS